MRIILLVCVAGVVAGVVAGCKDRVMPTAGDYPSVVEVAPEVDSDTLYYDDEVDESPEVTSADELFDDFIFTFANSPRHQLRRITFPLVWHKRNRTDTIRQNEWEIERFFIEQDYYTLILDDESSLEAVKDTGIDHAIVEKIYLSSGYVTQYLFAKDRQRWQLIEVNDTTFLGTARESFLRFYQQFTTDSLFQLSSIASPLKFTGPDPDDDFATIEGVIMPEQWQMFAPDLPRGMIYNIVYGTVGERPDEKLFVVRGIANGLETSLLFRRRSGQWHLVELSM